MVICAAWKAFRRGLQGRARGDDGQQVVHQPGGDADGPLVRDAPGAKAALDADA
jgi:hypothetical protein